MLCWGLPETCPGMRGERVEWVMGTAVVEGEQRRPARQAEFHERRGLLGAVAQWLPVPVVLAVVSAVVLAMLAAPMVPAAAAKKPATTAAQGPGAPSGPVIAAYYFGNADPLNFWSSDLSGAAQTFQQMHQQGFNTVGLVVPWDDFEPQLDPPTYNSIDFARLDQLVSLAASMHLNVMVRLSFAADWDPSDALEWGVRFAAVYNDPTTYATWLNYISQLHANLSAYPNVVFAYLSWEDFFNPYWEVLSATTLADRLALARSMGYRDWLEGHYSLTKVNQIYGQNFTSWSQVPTPRVDQPAFRMLYRFMDQMLVGRFFLPALQRYPGLTLEARADNDLLFKGTQVWRRYLHTSQWDIPGTIITGIDFDPNMRDPSSSPNETASEALQSLDSTLSTVASGSGGRRLFIYQFLFYDNARIAANGPHLTPDQVAPFLQQATAPLEQYTDGYGIWTYRNYNVSLVYNPSFSLGLTGWTVGGSVGTANPTGGPTYARLSSGSTVKQRVPVGRLGGGSAPVTISFLARSPSRAQLKVQLDNAPSHSVVLGSSWRSYQFTYPESQVTAGRLRLSAAGKLDLTKVEVYDFTQQGDVQGVSGKPRGGLAPLESLNQRIASNSPS